MHNQKLNKYIYLAIFSVFLAFTSTQIYELTDDKNVLLTKDDISSSAIWNLIDPIVIDDTDPSKNWSKTAMENPWCNGSGTWIDPYLISDVEIDIDGESEDAISISNSEVHFKIKNCDVLNTGSWSSGIYLDNVSNGKIFDNNIHNTGDGVYIVDCESIAITNNVIDNVFTRGMSIINCNKSLFQSNNITNFSDEGIRINSCYNSSFNLNIISSNTSREYGIKMESSDHNEIKLNTIYDLDSGYADGIYLNAVNNNTISENEVSGCRKGIFLNLGEHNNVTKNYCYANADEGLYLGFSSYSKITENMLINNSIGFSINEADLNYIFKNEINFNEHLGIYAYRSSNNILENNTVAGSQDKGIFLVQCVEFNLSGNIMFNNGLYFEDSDWSDEELKSHNIDSTNQVNNRNLFYYTNKSGLRESDFANAGQVILYNCTDSVVKNSNLSRVTCGLLSWYGQNNTLIGNDLSYNSRSGMEIHTAEKFNIANNIANHCWGLSLYNINNSAITGNTANYNIVGISISGDNNDISYNTVEFNEETGMVVSGFNHTISSNTANRNRIGISLTVSNSTFTNNYANYNSLYGLYLDDANYNLITGNDFIGNTIDCINQEPNCQGNIIRDNNCIAEGDLFWSQYMIWIIVGIVLAVSFSVVIIILRKIVKKRKKYSE